MISRKFYVDLSKAVATVALQTFRGWSHLTWPEMAGGKNVEMCGKNALYGMQKNELEKLERWLSRAPPPLPIRVNVKNKRTRRTRWRIWRMEKVVIIVLGPKEFDIPYTPNSTITPIFLLT